MLNYFINKDSNRDTELIRRIHALKIHLGGFMPFTTHEDALLVWIEPIFDIKSIIRLKELNEIPKDYDPKNYPNDSNNKEFMKNKFK